MRVEGNYYVWDKGEDIKLGTYFDAYEFQCRCTYETCKEQRINMNLISKLNATRYALALPIVISSGFRCRHHQMDLSKDPSVETVDKSTHELGDAADIQSRDMTKLGMLLPQRWKAIGTGVTFFHIDERADKTRRWSYSY